MQHIYGGCFPRSNILKSDNGSYFIAQNNTILEYSQKFELLRKFTPSTHNILKISFRSYSQQQIIVVVQKRIIIFDLPTDAAVSTYELNNGTIMDCLQFKEDLIIYCNNQSNYPIHRLQIKPQINNLDKTSIIYAFQRPIYNMKIFQNNLLFSDEKILVNYNLLSNQCTKTIFQELITCIEVNKHLLIGFVSGNIVLLHQLPREGSYNSNQGIRLDKHFDKVVSICYQDIIIYSCQKNMRLIGFWIKRDQSYFYNAVQCFGYQPTHLQLIGELLFVHTKTNQILVLDSQHRLQKLITSVPLMEKDVENKNQIQCESDYFYVHAHQGCLMKADCGFKNPQVVNCSSRDIVSAMGDNKTNTIEYYSVVDETIYAITHFNEYSLIVMQGQNAAFNVFNVLPDVIGIRSYKLNSSNVTITFVLSKHGYKIFTFDGCKLEYVGFKRMTELQDLAMQEMYLDGGITVQYVTKGSLCTVVYSRDLIVVSKTELEVLTPSKENQITKVLCTNSHTVIQTYKTLVIRSPENTTEIAFRGIICGNGSRIFGYENNKIFQVTHELQEYSKVQFDQYKVHNVSVNQKEQFCFLITRKNSDGFVPYVCVWSAEQLAESLEESEEQQQINPILLQKEQVEQVPDEGFNFIKFKSQLLSWQLAAGKDVFDQLTE